MAFQDIEGHLMYTLISNIIAAVGTMLLCTFQIINLFITPARSEIRRRICWSLTAGFVAAGICVNCYFLLDTSERFSHALQTAQTRISSSCSEYALNLSSCSITLNLTDEEVNKGVQFNSEELSLVKERLTDRVLEQSKLLALNITIYQVISGVNKIIMDLNTVVVRHKNATETFEEAMQNLIGSLDEMKKVLFKNCFEKSSITNDPKISAELFDTTVLIITFNKGLRMLQKSAVDIHNFTDIIKSNLDDYKEAYTMHTLNKRFENITQRINITATKDCKEAMENGKSNIKGIEKIKDIEHYRWTTCLWLTSSLLAFAIVLCTSIILKAKNCFEKVPKCPARLLKHISNCIWIVGLFLLTIAVCLNFSKMASLSCISVIKSSFNPLVYDYNQPDFIMTPLESVTTEKITLDLIKQAELLQIIYKIPKLDVVQNVVDSINKNLSIASSRRYTSKHCLDELSYFVEKHPTHNIDPNVSHYTEKLNMLLREDMRNLNLSASILKTVVAEVNQTTIKVNKLVADKSNLAVMIATSNISDVLFTLFKELQQIVTRQQNVIISEFHKKMQDGFNHANHSMNTCVNNSEILCKEFTEIATTWYIAFVAALVLLIACTAMQNVLLCLAKNAVAPLADSTKEDPEVNDDADKKNEEKTTNNGEERVDAKEVDVKATEICGNIEDGILIDDTGTKNAVDPF
ncbi:uncharacterized protein LOC131954111 [Physella acuta]|uniref:uncharacterized protein LOC131954111 n=1 Tax=Physella acuta TaxID=109671 RepID=UPI0027DB0049|nr:uncharacterized protein LOC131954111 [Physella acuta]